MDAQGVKERCEVIQSPPQLLLVFASDKPVKFCMMSLRWSSATVLLRQPLMKGKGERTAWQRELEISLLAQILEESCLEIIVALKKKVHTEKAPLHPACLVCIITFKSWRNFELILISEVERQEVLGSISMNNSKHTILMCPLWNFEKKNILPTLLLTSLWPCCSSEKIK